MNSNLLETSLAFLEWSSFDDPYRNIFRIRFPKDFRHHPMPTFFWLNTRRFKSSLEGIKVLFSSRGIDTGGVSGDENRFLGKKFFKIIRGFPTIFSKTFKTFIQISTRFFHLG